MRRFINCLLSAFLFFVFTNCFAIDQPWDNGHQTSEDEPLIDEKSLEPTDPCTGISLKHNHSPSKETGSPVELKKGSLIWTELDILVEGRFPLVLTRTFSSESPVRTIFGKGWSSNCQRTLVQTLDFDAIHRGANNPYRYNLRLANGKTFVFGDDDQLDVSPKGIKANVTSNGDTTTLTWASGKVDTYQDGRLVREEDNNSNSITYRYVNDRIDRMETNDGRYLTFVHDTQLGVIRSVSDNTGRTWVYGYDDAGNLETVATPTGTKRYTYLPPGSFGNIGLISELYAHLTSVSDASGVVILNVNYHTDNYLNLAKVESYTNGLHTYAYEYLWTESENPAWVDRVIKTGQSQRWTYTLNRNGQVTKEEGPTGTTEFQLNNDYAPLITNVNTGYTLRTTYDDLGRPITIDSGRGEYIYGYEGNHLTPTSIQLPAGVGTYEYRLDSNGNLEEYDDLDKNTYVLTRNTYGDIETISIPGITEPWRITYNAHGLTESITSPEGKTEWFFRNSRGFIETYRNGDNKEWKFTYDPMGRKLTETSPLNIVTTFTYDGAGRLLTISNHENETYSYTYDLYGRLDEETNFWGGVFDYQYYPNSRRLSKVVHPDSTETDYFYNERNLLRRKETSDQFVEYGYDDYGRISTITNNNGEVTYKFNPWNQVIEEKINGQTNHFRYDELGRLDAETRFGIELDHEYNTNNLLQYISTPAGDINFTYDDASRPQTVARPIGVTTTYKYYDDDTLESITHGSVGTFQYVLDDARRIREITGFDNTRTYGYDDDNRLRSVIYSAALPDGTTSESFSYDELGNRNDESQVYDAGSQLRENLLYSYQYDSNGNRSRRDNKQTGSYELYDYSNWNQLIRYRFFESASSSSPSREVSYSYGPEGRRWNKVDNGIATLYYWSGMSQIGSESNGELTRNFKGVIDRNGEYFYSLQDHLGTSKVILNSNGIPVWRGEAKAYGRTYSSLDSFEWPHRFPGQVEDPESGLHYNNLRDYDPDTGRYLQSDPIGIAGGVNLYNYAVTNPISNKDNLGTVWAQVITWTAYRGAPMALKGGQNFLRWCGAGAGLMKEGEDADEIDEGAEDEGYESDIPEAWDDEEVEPGEFSISDWDGYPEGVPKPKGTTRLLEGTEYDSARKAANAANRKIRTAEKLKGKAVDVHEIKPVKFNGSPTNKANKVIIDRSLHRQQVTPWWNKLLKDLSGN